MLKAPTARWLRGGAVDQLAGGDQRHIDLPFVERLDIIPTKRNDTQQYTS